MFEAHQEEMQADIDDKDERIDALEVSITHGIMLPVVDMTQARLASANTSAGHKEAAESKSRFELEARVNKLEATVEKLKTSEKEARDELTEMLKEEKNNEGSVSCDTSCLSISP